MKGINRNRTNFVSARFTGVHTAVRVTTFAMGASWALQTPVYAGAKDDPLIGMIKVDQFEVRAEEGDDPLVMDAQAWIGHDLHKIWLKSEVEHVGSEVEEAEFQALYSRAIAPFWDVQFGLRHDVDPNPSRNWAVVGFQGLSPYFFEIDAALFIGGSGRTAFRLEAEYEFMITQKWVLSPELEMNLYGKDDAELAIGSGLSDIEIGLRLRYEIIREFAPYIGINVTRKLGSTADIAQKAGEDKEQLQWVLGVRTWY